MSIDPQDFLSALAEPTRLRSLVLMAREQPLCVCELTWALDISQPKMSRHLASLRERRIVDDRKVANRVYYRLSRELPAWARAVLANVADGVGDSGEFVADRQRLKAMPNRPERIAVAWRS